MTAQYLHTCIKKMLLRQVIEKFLCIVNKCHANIVTIVRLKTGTHDLQSLLASVNESNLTGLPWRDLYPLIALIEDLRRAKLILMRIHEITWPHGSPRFPEIRSARCLYPTAVDLLIPSKIDKTRGVKELISTSLMCSSYCLRFPSSYDQYTASKEELR